MHPARLLERIRRHHLQNVDFLGLVGLLDAVGFRLDRIRGSHHVYRHPSLRRRLVLQPEQGRAKPYQLRQLLRLMEEYNLVLEREP